MVYTHSLWVRVCTVMDCNLADSRGAFVLERLVQLHGRLGSMAVAPWLLPVEVELIIVVHGFC